MVREPGGLGDLLGNGFAGSIELRRRFHRPTGLDASSQVWLLVEPGPWTLEVSLNGRSLVLAPAEPTGVVGEACFVVTPLLLAENMLSITLTSLAPVEASAPEMQSPIIGFKIPQVRLAIE